MKVSGTFRHRTRFLSVFVVLGLLFMACGEDDTDEASDTTESEASGGDPAAFCDAAIDIETSLGAGRADVGEQLQTAEDNAPEEVSESVTSLVRLLREVLAAENEEEGFAIFESPEFTQADDEIDQWMLDNCEGVEKVEVTAVDYEFQGMPPSVPSGQVAFTLDNQGTEVHELVLFQINEGVTETVEQLLQLPEEEVMTKITEFGGSFAEPGDSGTFFLNLESGRYGAVCFVPVGSTPEAGEEVEGPPHTTEGMFAEFEATS